MLDQMNGLSGSGETEDSLEFSDFMNINCSVYIDIAQNSEINECRNVFQDLKQRDFIAETILKHTPEIFTFVEYGVFNQNINGSTVIGNPINITEYMPFDNVTENIINSLIAIACILGFVGNGMVIWLLGFRIQRTPFTTYILNLAIADFGVLFTLLTSAAMAIALDVYEMTPAPFIFFLELFFFTYSTGQFLLAAISIDRCVAVLFPLWHRCHRPPHLSTIVCALIWILSFLLPAIHFTLYMNESSPKSLLRYMFILNAFFCPPLMVISALTLFLKVFCKAQQRQRGKLATVILLTLLFFLILAFPLNALYIIIYYYGLPPRLMTFGFLCASLNSSINPLIYFLVGKRQKKGKSRFSMKVALQRVFKDEEDSKEEQKSTTESQLL